MSYENKIGLVIKSSDFIYKVNLLQKIKHEKNRKFCSGFKRSLNIYSFQVVVRPFWFASCPRLKIVLLRVRLKAFTGPVGDLKSSFLFCGLLVGVGR